MVCTTKKMTVSTTGDLNGSPVTVVVCFEPQGTTFDSTIAWQVKTFQDGVYDSTSPFTWTSNYAFSAVQDQNDPQAYQYMNGDTQTAMLLDTTTTPPTYSFTNPQASKKPAPKVFNKTGANANIGWGFITAMGTMQEAMCTVNQWNNVKAGDSRVPTSWAPVMSIYVIPNYAGSLSSGDPISSAIGQSYLKYQQDLRTLSTALTADFELSYDPTLSDYVISAPQAKLQASFAAAAGSGIGADKRKYNATIDFAGIGGDFLPIVSQMLTTLISIGYEVAVSLSATFAEPVASVDLVLPYTTSCGQAERDVLNAIGIKYGVAILERSGQALSYDLGTSRGWTRISPASDDWNKDRAGKFVAIPTAVEAVAPTNGAAAKDAAGTKGAVAVAAVTAEPEAIKAGTIRRRKQVIL
ncbi:uncharacterized protein BXZ73DRAFT_99356 [Epithele typhae]|uniref:uncharacterized protein n=1 Tax=Epithele typhae TaxID=378194 RepID=UPI0020078A1C|nr:uncharacterized protein BXZ73DRAFT_99356 [Epithele typhae]KAH9939724.1 hypothetical protein BXZ73DRAFT_99356 [Epithele typhae]